MTATMFLSQLWGPILLAVGIGFFTSRAQYVQLYRDLQKESLAVLTFGIGAVLLGMIQLNGHNLWGTLNEVVISILAWGTLIKGFAFLIFPGVIERAAHWESRTRLVPFVGVLLIVVGAYLSIVGYYLS